MSAVKAYEFLSKRIELAGWTHVGDAFSVNDAASSLFHKSYLLQFKGSSVDENGDRSVIISHSFTLILLMSGWQRDLNSVKEAMKSGEDLLISLLDTVGMASENILAVTLQDYELSPFDEGVNDDKLLFVANLKVKNAMCIKQV